jgi:hypothetical protein
MSFINNRVVLGPNEDKLLQVSDHPLIFKATKEDTNGAYSLFEANLVRGAARANISMRMKTNLFIS